MSTEKFPIDLTRLQPLELDPAAAALTDAQRATLKHNIQLFRDAIVFVTALAGAKGLAGHTGGPYDTVPELLIVRAFIAGGAPIVPICFDEAGHRVATQYLLSVLHGAMPAEKLLHYREFDSELPGHPEKLLTPGVEFSSGRLGHLWAFCNGIAMANPGKAVVLFGSDGSEMEGDNAEAARLAVGKQLNIKVLIDDNNSTIAGRPQDYMAGYDLTRSAPPGGGYVVALGETVYRALDAILQLQERGLQVGLVNKSTVNVVDHDMMAKLASAPFVLVVEGWNVKTGLGSRFGSYLLQAGFRGRYNHLGSYREGAGGQWQQMGHQGLAPAGIIEAIEALARSWHRPDTTSGRSHP